ncbi:hypothetical protein RGQ21_18420 [Kitasatospora aureofaciens]|nr:hypothetical protein RGQ21_18420 [Kitasatospora aureofaciens]
MPFAAVDEAVGAVGDGHVDVGFGVVGEGDDVVLAVAVVVADVGEFAGGGEVFVPAGAGAVCGSVGQGDVDVGFGALGEGDDVVFLVAVDVADAGEFSGGCEVVVDELAGAEGVFAVGEGGVDVGGGALGEGDEVVVSVAVDVAEGGEFAAGGEVVVPDGGGVEAVGAVGEGDVDLGVGVVGEGDDVVVAVAVDVADGGDFAAGEKWSCQTVAVAKPLPLERAT